MGICTRIGQLAVVLLLLLGFGSRVDALPLLDIDVGLKGGVAGNLLLVEEKFANDYVRIQHEDDDAFGVGGGGGLYAELRLLDAVGLEVDLLYSRDQVTRTEKWTFGPANYLKLNHTSWADNLRVPVLLKGFLSLGPVRLSLGGGIEYVHTLDHGYDIEEAEQANVIVYQENLDKYRAAHHSVAKSCTFLVGQLELAIDLVFISIPIDLRAGYNLSQTDTFEDRFHVQGSGDQTTVEIQAIYTWDFRALAGVAWSF